MSFILLNLSHATLLHCMHLENLSVEPCFFMCDAIKAIQKTLHATPKKSFFSCWMQHFCCMKQIFFNVAPWSHSCTISHSMTHFCEAQLLLANHKTCLKRFILERMLDFKNIHKQFYFKNNMVQGKMTDEEKQTLISFSKQNPILWDNADQN